jgi:hypothetical protein
MDEGQKQWDVELGIVYLKLFTHPFALGFHVLCAPSESIYEVSFNLGWIGIEVFI